MKIKPVPLGAIIIYMRNIFVIQRCRLLKPHQWPFKTWQKSQIKNCNLADFNKTVETKTDINRPTACNLYNPIYHNFVETISFEIGKFMMDGASVL